MPRSAQRWRPSTMALPENPELLNSDPYGKGWMVQVEGGDVSGLMDATAYTKYCEERAH